MFFTLLFSTLLWQSVHAMSPEERAAEQKAIEAECKPLLADSQIIYNTCIAKGGQKAQAARKQESVNEPAKPVVCNPSGALSACEAASTRAAKINNPNAPDIEVEEAIVACLSACNPQSSKVLAAYFDDCNSSTKAYEDQMKIYLNKCGYKVSAKDQQPEEDKSLTDRAVDLLPSKAKEFLFEKGWIGGKFESDARSSFSNAYSVPLNQDIDYVKTETRDGVIYKYRSSIDGSYHDSYASAESYNKRLSGPSFGKPSLPQPPAPSSDDLDASDRGTIAERADLAPDTSPNPPPRPDDFRAPPGEGRQEPVAGGGGNGGNTSGGGGAAPQDPIARQPAPSPQPMVPGNDGAFVNNALNAPIPNNSGGGMSPVSTGDSSEVSSSGSSSSSSSGYGGLGGGSNNSRGNFQGSGRQPLPTNNDTPELRPVSASIAGDTNINGNIATGGIGSAAGMGNVSGGRMVAAVSKTPAATLDGFGFPSEKMRSDNFYKTPGKGASPSRARLVKVDPNCKGKNCQWKQLPANGDSSTVNCEGNPQCLLALTGPLSAKKKKQLNDYWKVQKTGRGVASSSSVATPDTAVEPNNPKYIKGTWWKGLDSIVRHKEIIDQCFQTDHAGDLQSNCDL